MAKGMAKCDQLSFSVSIIFEDTSSNIKADVDVKLGICSQESRTNHPRFRIVGVALAKLAHW